MSSCRVCGASTGSADSVLCTACFNTGADLGSSGPLNGARASGGKTRTKAQIAKAAGFAKLADALSDAVAKRPRGRPRTGAERMITTSIQVLPSQWAAVNAFAAQTGQSSGAIVREALAHWLERASSGPAPE